MAWDLAINENGDLNGKIATGDDEILQRVKMRLNLELGEWFLNTEVGLPWYSKQRDGGILGSPMYNRERVELLIRQRIASTEGVARVLTLTSNWFLGTREYNMFVELMTTNNNIQSFNYAYVV